MTSRRAIPGYGQRESRAFQFMPGHLGGRVASAQPIRRRGGTLRRPAVGAVDALWGRVLLHVSGGGGGYASYLMLPFTRYSAEGTAPYGLEGLPVRLNLTLPTTPPDDYDVMFALMVSANLGTSWAPAVSPWTIPGPHASGGLFTVTYANPVESSAAVHQLAALFPYPSEDARWSAWSAAWDADPEPQAELVYPA